MCASFAEKSAAARPGTEMVERRSGLRAAAWYKPGGLADGGCRDVAGGVLVPGAAVAAATAISPEALGRRGIRALIVDLDNTLTLWNRTECAPEVAAWLGALVDAGVRVCIVSNNGPARVSAFCDALGGPPLPWIAHAGKPRRSAYLKALARLGAEATETAVVGDQVFTDIAGGNRAGLFTILVPPLGRREFPATRVARLVEGLWLRRLRSRGRLLPL